MLLPITFFQIIDHLHNCCACRRRYHAHHVVSAFRAGTRMRIEQFDFLKQNQACHSLSCTHLCRLHQEAIHRMHQVGAKKKVKAKILNQTIQKRSQNFLLLLLCCLSTVATSQNFLKVALKLFLVVRK